MAQGTRHRSRVATMVVAAGLCTSCAAPTGPIASPTSPSAGVTPVASGSVVTRARSGLIAYDTGGSIVVSRVDGSDAMTLPSSGRIETSPIWSPDGTRLAVLSQATQDGPAELVIEAPDGSNRQVAVGEVPSPERLLGASWSPSGSFLAYTTLNAATQVIRIYAVAASGGQPRVLVPSAPLGAWPVWSPDSRAIAFGGGHHHVHGRSWCLYRPRRRLVRPTADLNGGRWGRRVLRHRLVSGRRPHHLPGRRLSRAGAVRHL